MSQPKILSVRVEHDDDDSGPIVPSVGVIAKAVIVSSTGTHQTLRSPGEWVSARFKDRLKTTDARQLSFLRTELLSFGFGERAIARAFQHVETVNK